MFCSNCGKELKNNVKFCSNCGNSVVTKEEIKQPRKKVYDGLGILIIAIWILSAFFHQPDTKSPREFQNLKCVNYRNLCIATTDVKYDYTSVKSRTSGYPAYNNEWNNGWAAAQNACKAWGGRLPYMEDFVTIVDAFNNNKIQLENYESYLSNTQINTYRIWAYSHHDNYARNGYNNKSIYDAALSIEKSGDNIITGHYNTGTAYTYNARCVKDIK